MNPEQLVAVFNHFRDAIIIDIKRQDTEVQVLLELHSTTSVRVAPQFFRLDLSGCTTFSFDPIDGNDIEHPYDITNQHLHIVDTRKDQHTILVYCKGEEKDGYLRFIADDVHVYDRSGIEIDLRHLAQTIHI